MEPRKPPLRKDGRIIIHFDYDCFYASVFEIKNPALKLLPFAVQQKQIIVTCNYEARRRGLNKLQLVKEAKRICPDLIIELGEDISPFRDASKELYRYLKQFSWNGKVERLGFDEVWMDITDIVDYNFGILNLNSLEQSFFQTSRQDPTAGFAFNASSVCGYTFPIDHQDASAQDELALRLRLGSHLALYLRHELERDKGYTATVGIATNKTCAKLVGNLHKPEGQTTLMPPYATSDEGQSNVLKFMDGHEIGKVPGIGFKTAQKLREHYLDRPPVFDDGLIYGATKEKVTVADVRTNPGTTADALETLLAGPGSPHGIGYRIWSLLHGVDDAEVSAAKAVPSQISIEDSYIRLDTLPEVIKELTMLAKSLITRMRIDLTATDDDNDDGVKNDDDETTPDRTRDHTPQTEPARRWLAQPKTLRLTTRPRPPLRPDGTRTRSFKRISHSGPLPVFVLNATASIDALADRLVSETLLGMFRRLHPEKSGWNLSLVNLAVTNMAEMAGNSRTANGRDIGSMFKRQDDVLRDFRVSDEGSNDDGDDGGDTGTLARSGSQSREESIIDHDDGSVDDGSDTTTPVETHNGTEDQLGWADEEEEIDVGGERCVECGVRLPGFAMLAHQRFHSTTHTS